MTRSCPEHPNYQTARPPTRDCMMCWAAYGRRRAIDDGLRSQGKLKKANGARSKAKGREAVVLLRDVMLRAAPWLQDGDLLVKATSMGGCDLHRSPRAAEWCGYAIEAKNVEALNIWAALRQAEENAKPSGEPPVVFFKRAGSPFYAAVRATDFLSLLPRPLWPNPLDVQQMTAAPQPATPEPTPSPSSSESSPPPSETPTKTPTL